MLRHVLVSVTALVVLAVPAAAQAADAAECDAVLSSADDARTTLAQLEASLVEIDAETEELTKAVAKLTAKVNAAQAKGSSVMRLRAELDGMLHELEVIEDLRPTIVTQIDAMRASIDDSERTYIACIEHSLS